MILYISEFCSYAVKDRGPTYPDHGAIFPLELVEVKTQTGEDEWPMVEGFWRTELDIAKRHADRLEKAALKGMV